MHQQWKKSIHLRVTILTIYDSVSVQKLGLYTLAGFRRARDNGLEQARQLAS